MYIYTGTSIHTYDRVIRRRCLYLPPLPRLERSFASRRNILQDTDTLGRFRKLGSFNGFSWADIKQAWSCLEFRARRHMGFIKEYGCFFCWCPDTTRVSLGVKAATLLFINSQLVAESGMHYKITQASHRDRWALKSESPPLLAPQKIPHSQITPKSNARPQPCWPAGSSQSAATEWAMAPLS